MLDSRTCSGDRACHAGAVALDASHFVYLGRTALELSAGDVDGASILVAQLLRSTSCWQAGCLWTTTMILDDQVDQQLGLLGLAPPPGLSWTEYVMAFSPSPTVEPVQTVGGGSHDSALLARVLDEATRSPTLLVTNDEGLFERARARAIDSGGPLLTSSNSTTVMLSLLKCGAVPESVVDASLLAERKNVEDMRRKGMDAEKYELKLRRLDRAGQELVLHRFDEANASPSDG